MKKLVLYFLVLFALHANLLAQVTVSGSTGADGNYTSLTNAGGAFAAINGRAQTGNTIIITITGNSTAETGVVGLNAGTWNTLTIYPTGSGFTISGSIAGALIYLNGADNVTIDGSVNAAGASKDLTLMNTSTASTAGTSTIRFINDATYNTIKNCVLKGSTTAAASGIIFFSTSVAGTTGNDHNTIENNNITNSSDLNRPVNTIYSLGTLNKENSDNIIRNNWIYDFLNRGTTSYGIYLSSYSTSWSITGNSFYETTSFIPTASGSYNAILINNPSGNGFTVSGNYIGGSAALCGGSPWTKNNNFNNPFVAINMVVGGALATEIQNNTIQNIAWSNSLAAGWTGIGVSGGIANIGTISGNTIGSISGTGSVTVTGGATGMNVTGIYIAGSGTKDCENNNIGSITASNTNPLFATNIFGINNVTTAGTTTLNNNTIGSTATANSINSSSVSSGNPQTVFGISNTGGGNISMNGNTIANLNNGSTNITTTTRGRIDGILSTNGSNLISNNVIHNLTNANANGGSNELTSVCGIALTGAGFLKTITGNTIYNLYNSFPSFTGFVIGLYFTGSTGGNVVSQNFIYGLTVAPGSTAGNICGIRIVAGTTTYSNNIINLGGNTATTIYGIYESGIAGNNDNFYFNTVYLGGTPASGTNRSYSLYSSSNTNTRDYRNNLFVNARSTSGRANLHYAFDISIAGGSITCDYNDYFVSGTGGILGCYGLNRTILPIVTGQDVNSQAVNPVFVNAGSSTATDYKIGADLIGISGTGITTDYGSVLRVNPTMGAWERPVNKWIGTTSTDWNTLSNWTGNALPVGNNPSIIFDNAVVNHLFLDKDHPVNNITNGQSAYRMVTNGHKLTIKGNLIFTGGAQIDASSSGSSVEFAGTAPQTIPSGSFYNDRVYNLIINNINNVTLNGSLSLLNNFTVPAGLLDAYSGTPTFIYAGTAAQTTETARFLNNKVYNLTIDNTAGVTLNTDFTVDNSMTINPGKLFTIPVVKQLTVTGTLTNNAGNTGLVIKSGATGEGRLINNTPSVPATVELYLTGGLISPTVGIFHYFCPPVETMYIGTTDAEVNAALGLTYFDGSLLRYVEPASVSSKNQGWQYYDNYPGPPPGFTSVQSSEGYNIYLNGPSDILKFKGLLNATEHTFNLSYTPGNKGAGWNLVGNPYPCNYDLNGVDGIGTAEDDINGTLYYNNNGNYTYWNVLSETGTTGMAYTDILPPMTGFYVYLTGPKFTNLVFPVSSKTSSVSDPRTLHKRSLSDGGINQNFKKVKLVLTSGSKSDETIVLLADDAVNSFNDRYDAFKLFEASPDIPHIYSEMEGIDYFMKAVSGPVSSQVIVPLKLVIREPGLHKINISEFENLEGTNVVLKHGNVETSLNKNTSYSFTSGAGTYSDFELIFGSSNSKAPDKMKETVDFKTWYNNNSLYFNITGDIQAENGSFIITDYYGRQVYNNKNIYIVPGQTTQVQVNLEKGFYITDVMINNMHYKSKFVVY